MKRPLPNTMRFGSWEGARYRTARVTLGQGNDVVPIRIKHPQRGSVARPVLPVKLEHVRLASGLSLFFGKDLLRGVEELHTVSH